MEKLFAEKECRLNSCVLVPLTGDDAPLAARALADIDPWRRAGYRSDKLLGYLLNDDPALSRYQVLVDKKHAGVICIRYPWLHGPYLELIGLFDGYQGRGLGRELMLWFEAQARGRARSLWLAVSTFNTSALRFYKRLGFAEVAALEKLTRDDGDEILMRKIISK
jgi:ribosomal protein S18 acetylase RimI-like enzyme